MAYKCEVCGKGAVSGQNVPHSKHRTKRKFLPNLQSKSIIIDGEKKKARICTKCIKTYTYVAG